MQKNSFSHVQVDSRIYVQTVIMTLLFLAEVTFVSTLVIRINLVRHECEIHTSDWSVGMGGGA